MDQFLRWVFSGTVDVPAHAESGITEDQTRSLLSDRRLPAHVTGRDGDKWKMLPAEYTHISIPITVSQQRNSSCQSGLANICQLTLFASTFRTSSFHTCLQFWILCVCVIQLALLYFCYDISLTRKNKSMIGDQLYNLQPLLSNLRGAPTLRNMMYYVNTFFIFLSHLLPSQNAQIMQLSNKVCRHILFLVVRYVSTRVFHHN